MSNIYKTVYILNIYHNDTFIAAAFVTLDEAIKNAKVWMDEHDYDDSISNKELDIRGCEYYCTYSNEGDYVRVTKGILYD